MVFISHCLEGYPQLNWCVLLSVLLGKKGLNIRRERQERFLLHKLNKNQFLLVSKHDGCG